MKDLTELNCFRCRVVAADDVDNPRTDGRFVIPLVNMGISLRVIASSCNGWDHVSVSLETTATGDPIPRTPTWEEMEIAAQWFFRPEETAMQLHVPASDHINDHPYVLHWWRPWSKLRRIPRPPKFMV